LKYNIESIQVSPGRVLIKVETDEGLLQTEMSTINNIGESEFKSNLRKTIKALNRSRKNSEWLHNNINEVFEI